MLLQQSFIQVLFLFSNHILKKYEFAVWLWQFDEIVTSNGTRLPRETTNELSDLSIFASKAI